MKKYFSFLCASTFAIYSIKEIILNNAFFYQKVASYCASAFIDNRLLSYTFDTILLAHFLGLGVDVQIQYS